MTLLPALLALALSAEPPNPGFKTSHLFTLSTFTGPVRSNWAVLATDPTSDEIYAAQGTVVGIYNRMGMQIHDFGGDGSIGIPLGMAVMEDGDAIVLSAFEGQRTIFRTDYRGEVLGRFDITGLPAELERVFQPDLVGYRAGKLYFGESSRMNIVVTDLTGKTLSSYDMKKLLKLDETQLNSAWMRGLSVDREGRVLLTLPLLFKVAIVSPDQTVKLFGTRGSTPGRFNIVGKMVADEDGNHYVTDTLRCVVMVFDPDFKFIGEFGYRGDEPENLISPVEVAVKGGRVYVAQAGSRGVSVFQVKLPPPPPVEGAAPAPAAAAPPTSAPASPPSRAAPR